MGFHPVGGRHCSIQRCSAVGVVPEKTEEAAAGSAWAPAMGGGAGRPPGMAAGCWAGAGALTASLVQDNF